MSNRFHNKWHRHNHHTNATGGEPDSAHDPIASPADPFRGDFHVQGTISSHNVFTTLLCATSSILSVTDMKITELSGFTVKGDDIRTSVPSIFNPNTEQGITLNGVGITANRWASFAADVKVGENLSVVNLISTKDYNTSNEWNSVYTTSNSNSAKWESVYTTVSVNSAVWGTGSGTGTCCSVVTANSGNWNSVYTTTNTNSAKWMASYTTVTANSGNWNSTYNTVNTYSPNWNTAYTTVTSSSAEWSQNKYLPLLSRVGENEDNFIYIGGDPNYNINSGENFRVRDAYGRDVTFFAVNNGNIAGGKKFFAAYYKSSLNTLEFSNTPVTLPNAWNSVLATGETLENILGAGSDWIIFRTNLGNRYLIDTKGNSDWTTWSPNNSVKITSLLSNIYTNFSEAMTGSSYLMGYIKHIAHKIDSDNTWRLLTLYNETSNGVFPLSTMPWFYAKHQLLSANPTLSSIYALTCSLNFSNNTPGLGLGLTFFNIISASTYDNNITTNTNSITRIYPNNSTRFLVQNNLRDWYHEVSTVANSGWARDYFPNIFGGSYNTAGNEPRWANGLFTFHYNPTDEKLYLYGVNDNGKTNRVYNNMYFKLSEVGTSLSANRYPNQGLVNGEAATRFITYNLPTNIVLTGATSTDSRVTSTLFMSANMFDYSTHGGYYTGIDTVGYGVYPGYATYYTIDKYGPNKSIYYTNKRWFNAQNNSNTIRLGVNGELTKPSNYFDATSGLQIFNVPDYSPIAKGFEPVHSWHIIDDYIFGTGFGFNKGSTYTRRPFSAKLNLNASTSGIYNGFIGGASTPISSIKINLSSLSLFAIFDSPDVYHATNILANPYIAMYKGKTFEIVESAPSLIGGLSSQLYMYSRPGASISSLHLILSSYNSVQVGLLSARDTNIVIPDPTNYGYSNYKTFVIAIGDSFSNYPNATDPSINDINYLPFIMAENNDNFKRFYYIVIDSNIKNNPSLFYSLCGYGLPQLVECLSSSSGVVFNKLSGDTFFPLSAYYNINVDRINGKGYDIVDERYFIPRGWPSPISIVPTSTVNIHLPARVRADGGYGYYREPFNFSYNMYTSAYSNKIGGADFNFYYGEFYPHNGFNKYFGYYRFPNANFGWYTQSIFTSRTYPYKNTSNFSPEESFWDFNPWPVAPEPLFPASSMLVSINHLIENTNLDVTINPNNNIFIGGFYAPLNILTTISLSPNTTTYLYLQLKSSQTFPKESEIIKTENFELPDIITRVKIGKIITGPSGITGQIEIYPVGMKYTEQENLINGNNADNVHKHNIVSNYTFTGVTTAATLSQHGTYIEILLPGNIKRYIPLYT